MSSTEATRNLRMRKCVMLGAAPRTQRSISSFQLPTISPTEVISTPIFRYATSDFVYDLRTLSSRADTSDGATAKKDLKELLMKRWEEAKKKKVFNYDLNCMYKLLEGEYNLSIQLNEERGLLRRKPMRFRAINEPFNNIRWNFTKLNQDETLMYLKCDDKPLSDDPLDRHVVAVNASPLERGHSLVVPCINKALPQRFECLSPDLYQIRPPDWFVPAFAFQLAVNTQLDRFVSKVIACVEFLTAKKVAHNVFFTRAQPIRTDGPQWSEDRKRELPQLVTVYIFPRRSITGAKPAMNFNPAANELAGCLTSYTYRFFESVTELNALRIIEEECALGEKQFSQLSSELRLLLSPEASTCNGDLAKATSREASAGRLEELLTSPELDELHDSFHTFQLRSPKRMASVPDTRQRSRTFL